MKREHLQLFFYGYLENFSYLSLLSIPDVGPYLAELYIMMQKKYRMELE